MVFYVGLNIARPLYFKVLHMPGEIFILASEEHLGPGYFANFFSVDIEFVGAAFGETPISVTEVERQIDFTGSTVSAVNLKGFQLIFL